MLGDVLGEGQLDEDTVDTGVVVVGAKGVEEFGFGDVLWEFYKLSFDVGLRHCQ